MISRDERTPDISTLLRGALEGKQATMWTALPAQVISFNAAAMTVDAQPTIKGVQNDENGNSQQVDLPVLPDLPVVFPGGGGFTLTFPIKEGDECLVVFASRCIDGWWQSGENAPAPDNRMHDLSDGFAMVGPRSQVNTISNINTENVELRADDGQSFVSISPDGSIMAEALTAITLKAPLLNLLVNDIHMAGTSGGNSTANMQGDFNINGDFKANGISLNSHKHGGVQAGGSQTGGPV